MMEKRTVYGLPLAPRSALAELAGASFCVSYATRGDLGNQLEDAMRLVGRDGLLLVDNGAYSLHKRGEPRTEAYVDGFEAWATEILERCPAAVAVIPDVIDGDEFDNIDCVKDSLLDPDRAMPVWHLNESLEYLLWLCEGFNYVAFGSAGEYWKPGTPAWHARVAEAFAAIDKWELESEGAFVRPRLHLMRAQSMAHLYPFDSSDSCNVAMNHGRYRGEGTGHIGRFAARVDAKIQATAGPPADHQIKRPLGEDYLTTDRGLVALLKWALPGRDRAGLGNDARPMMKEAA